MEETDVTTARLGDFLSYAKIRSPNPERLNAKAHIERIAGLMRDDFSDVGVSLETDVEPLAIEADPDMLSQILVNLLTNCLKFTEKGDKVAIKLTSDKKVARRFRFPTPEPESLPISSPKCSSPT